MLDGADARNWREEPDADWETHAATLRTLSLCKRVLKPCKQAHQESQVQGSRGV